MNNSLENVKVGELLYVSNGCSEGIEKVERTTDTLVITKLHRFSKKNGTTRGGDLWSRWIARPATNEDLAKQQHKILVRRCEDIGFRRLSDAQLEAILSVVKGDCEVTDHVPKAIVNMMVERGYDGSKTICHSQAAKWLLNKYDAWIEVCPRYMIPLDGDCETEVLLWELDVRHTLHRMCGDGYCAHYAIHQECNPSEQQLEDADTYGISVLWDDIKFYKTPEDAYCAGLIRTMLWLDGEKGGIK